MYAHPWQGITWHEMAWVPWKGKRSAREKRREDDAHNTTQQNRSMATHQHHIPSSSAQMTHPGPVMPLQMHYPQGQQQVELRHTQFGQETSYLRTFSTALRFARDFFRGWYAIQISRYRASVHSGRKIVFVSRERSLKEIGRFTLTWGAVSLFYGNCQVEYGEGLLQLDVADLWVYCMVQYALDLPSRSIAFAGGL